MPSGFATALFILLAVGAGVCLATQQLINAGFRLAVGSTWWAAFVSYFGGLIVVVGALVATRSALPGLSTLRSVPTLSWTGGLLGSLYIMASIFLLPRLGVALVLALVVVGQMSASMIFDQFGLLGVPQHSISPARILGAAALVGGVVLIKVG